MSQPDLVKVYGNLYPVQHGLLAALRSLSPLLLPKPDESPFQEENGLLAISFEGVFFPLEEALLAIKKGLDTAQKGKLDYLDLENWRMIRYLIENGEIARREAPLNNILAYSGH